MAKNRSRRLRKKLHIGEFQEIGFSVSWSFAKDTAPEEIDRVVAQFVNELIEHNGLAFEGGGYLQWDGLICLQKAGKCSDEQRELVRQWLEKQQLQEIVVSELFDI